MQQSPSQALWLRPCPRSLVSTQISWHEPEMPGGLSVPAKQPEQLHHTRWTKPVQLCCLQIRFQETFFVPKEHKFHWMSRDIEVYVLRNKLCEQFRDRFLSPYSLDSHLKLKQMRDRHLNSFTWVAVEHLWKHYPKSQIALSQQSQSRPFTCLKHKGFFCLFV